MLPTAILLCLAATPAASGAWPRAEGEKFLSARTDFNVNDMGAPIAASVYGEYGLRNRITLIGQFSSADAPWLGSRASLSVQYALSPEHWRHKFAISGGVSAPPDTMGLMLDTQIETALHWGLGFESRYGPGWATITARVLQPIALQPSTDTKIITDVYGVVGVRPQEGWMTMISTSRYENSDGVTWKVSPSMGYELREKAWIVPNVTREFGGGDDQTTLGLAIWLTF
jgi:hypothetical protein